MNNGAFGENFPYSNFHDLNLDWIIKIAKDFLDQYTHIQETITAGETSVENKTAEGIAELQTKATELEGLLQAWYNTHSNDIATQLETAIVDFISAADTKTEQSIASIPADYTTLSNSVARVSSDLENIVVTNAIADRLYEENMYVNYTTHQETPATGFNLYRIPCSEHDYVFITINNYRTVYEGFTIHHALNLVTNNDVYQDVQETAGQTSASNSYFYVPSAGDTALIAILVPANIKAISLSAKAGTENNITYNINRAYPIIKDGKTVPVLNYPYELTDEVGIRSQLYRTYNSDYRYSWVSLPAETLAIRVNAGDTVIYSNTLTGLSYMGTFIPDSNPTGRATRIATLEYTFRESGLLYSFILNGEFNATIFPVTPCQYLNKNGVAFGTSITYRAQTTGGYLQYLPSLLRTKTFENQGIGTSVIYPHGDYPNMLTAIKNYANYSTKDFCIIEGFVNDWGLGNTLGTWTDSTENSVCGCVRSAFNHILTQNPDITIILVLDPVGQVYEGADNSSLAVVQRKTQMEFYNTVAQVAESMGIQCIKLYQTSEMNEKTPSMYIDNIHPSARGAYQTANTIYYAMKNIPLKVGN